MDIGTLRDQLDVIDGQLIELLEKRMELCKQIGYEKKKISKSVYDKAREEEKLDSVQKSVKNQEYSEALRGVFSCIMDESKKIQNRIM
ncbi:MAG: chorismate mutase [Lachnospiraceae bacterium]|nr:chorismate mutase [Lachnospiraceae bacterium]